MLKPTWETEFRRQVAQHEALLSFVNDEDCVAFYEWWIAEGEEEFMCRADHFLAVVRGEE